MFLKRLLRGMWRRTNWMAAHAVDSLYKYTHVYKLLCEVCYSFFSVVSTLDNLSTDA